MYSIPIIPPDLRHEETIIQAAYALDCLNKTINLVFEQIDKRIEHNNVKVTSLVDRIEKAQAKIKGLVGTKKAIKIYAPARFPAAHVFHDTPITFTNQTKPSENLCMLLKDYEVQNRPETTLQTIQEKLVFFHVRSRQTPTNSVNDLMQVRMQAEQNIGKDKPENQVRSVPSLLLFNTDDCVYVEESTKDEPWKLAKLYKTQREQRQHQQQHQQMVQAAKVQKHLLEPAPHSLTHRNQIRFTPAGELRYMPKLDEAPEIDLPMDLPDLPGIADDIQFEANEHQQIAPSYFSAHLPELEELEEANKKSIKTEHTSEENMISQIKSKSNTNIPISQNGSKTEEYLSSTSNQSDHPPPPPPPPPPALSLSATPATSDTLGPAVSSTNASNSSSSTSAPPPPPPPPPPPTIPASDQNPLKTLTSTTSSDMHTNLMDAIRKAGGSRGGLLRTISNKECAEALQPSAQRDQPKKNLSNPSFGGDLMSDLHNKLQMRRKGISGANANQNNQSSDANKNPGTSTSKSATTTTFNPMMTRLSALIPPPPQPTQPQTQSQGTQATDEDDADWTE